MVEHLPNKPKLKYVEGNESLLNQIRPLWEALNQHHLALSKDFKQYYLDMTFPKRKADLLKKAALGKMHVCIATVESSGQAIGYCVSGINQERTGDIKSIFVLGDFRGLGIGDELMHNALKWLNENGAVERIVEVASGNEQAWRFYERYGFLPRKTMLKQVKKPKDVKAYIQNRLKPT